MNLSGLVAVSGKQGLFKVIGQNKAGYILQSLDEASSRLVVNTNARLAALNETTVYGRDRDIPLKEILLKMQEQKEALAMPDPKLEGTVLREYFTQIAPEHDAERVYASDMRKILTWFRMLEKHPLFTEEDPKEKEDENQAEKEAMQADAATTDNRPKQHAESGLAQAESKPTKNPSSKAKQKAQDLAISEVADEKGSATQKGKLHAEVEQEKALKETGDKSPKAHDKKKERK